MTMTLAVRDFSRYPGPRYRKDGPYSGQEFREEFLSGALRKAIAQGSRLTVLLDGVAGYGSSFLEEAFGGLVREGFPVAAIRQHLDIVAETDRFKHHRLGALRYIHDAAEREAA